MKFVQRWPGGTAGTKLVVSRVLASFVPRPHANPRKDASGGRGPFPAIRLGRPPVRALTAVAVLRPHKAVFDGLQSFFSFREGRALQQCEVFGLLLDIVSKSGDERLVGFSQGGDEPP